MDLRPAQTEILKYRGGQMAINAVPGSGKTFTLSMLAAKLLTDGRVDAEFGEQVLIVTYMNSSVDTFRSGIRQRLDEFGLPHIGFDVRTLHSLALEIITNSFGGQSQTEELPAVADESIISGCVSQAVDSWIRDNPSAWYGFLSDDSPRTRVRWREITERTSRTFIRTAKNYRYSPSQIMDRINRWNLETRYEGEPAGNITLLWMMAGVYSKYQSILENTGALDFDDLIWHATDLIESRNDLARALRHRWPFVLEDESQDSVPLQEALLSTMVGLNGNWVRVGDPNQAITSTFTSAHPRFFNEFLNRQDVQSFPLPNSGRSAPIIFHTANELIHWVCDQHPIPEVRNNCFRRQEILPTPPGDSQPNPLDSESEIRVKVYDHREDSEIPSIVKLADEYLKTQPNHTIAILVPTNEIGHTVASHLDHLKTKYDNLLRGSRRESQIAGVIRTLLSLIGEPMTTRHLVSVYSAMLEIGHPVVTHNGLDANRIQTLLRSVHRPESFLFPIGGNVDLEGAFPRGIVSDIEFRFIVLFQSFLRQVFLLKPLPLDDLVMTLSDQLFDYDHSIPQIYHDSDLSVAYLIANVLRRWQDLNPDWRLPDLTNQLESVEEGRRPLRLSSRADFGFKPEPGRITLTTQHGAKGMEWDAVFLVGVDGSWIPSTLEANFIGDHNFLGGDPSAEVLAQLRFIMEGQANLYTDHTATESAHIEIICERLRLLYVGITRAKRYLHISRSRGARRFGKDFDTPPTTAMAAIYHYLKEYN